ncbi:MAG: eCIS core domain-containing protein, partial [Candidatus Promineifilaceae bacterium]
MSTESAKSTTTKPKETQTKPAQAQQAGIPAQEMMGLGATQLAMHNGSMAGQASLLSRLHPPQRTAMVQRMARTHSNSHLTQVIARARAQEPPRETQIEEPSLLQQSLAQYGMGNLMSSGSAAPVDSGAPASSTTGKSSVTVQTKMTVNEVNDPFEQEADQVADQVMKTPTAAAPPPSGDLNNEGGTSAISRLVIQRVGGSDPLGGATVNAGVENRVNKLDGGGEPLSDSSRSFFESRMGADFSDVRIHRDASSAELSQDLNARAFTTGNNIAFNSGEYNPGTPDGDRLLAHELTHTVQQGAAGDLSRQTIQRKAIPLPEPPQPEATPELDGEASAALEAGQMPQMSEEMMAKAEEMGFGPEALSAGPSPQEPPPEEAPALEETERAEPAEPQGEPTNQEDVGELEQKPTEPIENKDWKEFFLNDIFNEIQRGKRLKKGDHKQGVMPYV